MTANQSPYKKDEQTFCQISNKGIKGNNIFKDEEDFNVFTDFLDEYLSPPSPITKKTFVVKGRSYLGVPHLPKNHSGKIELIAYTLNPDSFSILLKQVDKNSLEKFMRSLSTRYSMYFNKRHNHKGPVFAGPYKSKYIKDHQGLLDLSHKFHQNEHYSSLKDYLGTKKSPWVKSDIVLNYFNKVGSGKYSDFVKNKIADETYSGVTYIQTSPGFREFFTITAVFVVLVTIGVNRVLASGSNVKQNSSVLSVETSLAPSPVPDVQKMVITVITEDESQPVNIRSAPSTKSQKIGQAVNGEEFELLDTLPEWYKIKTTDDSVGYISAKYVQIPYK